MSPSPRPPRRPLRLYDTARRRGRPLRARPAGHMYTCGITPYDSTHLGHAATFITYDVLQRRLRDRGHDTRCVRNITDVDDPLLVKARELGIHYLDLAAREVARLEDDLEALNFLPVYSSPRATSAIGEIRKVVGRAARRGPRLRRRRRPSSSTCRPTPTSGASRTTTRPRCWPWPPSGAATPTTPASATRSTSCCGRRPATDEPAWESLWGPGRPGWHIECTALRPPRAAGDTIDLHGGGGRPHLPPPRVLGRPVDVPDRQAAGPPLDARRPGPHGRGTRCPSRWATWCSSPTCARPGTPWPSALMILAHHYRTDWYWHERAACPTPPPGCERWVRPAGDGRRRPGPRCAALDDDLDTPRALAAIDAAVAAGHGVSRAAALLGVV